MSKQKFYYTYRITLLCGSLKDHYYLGQHQTFNLQDAYPGSGTKLRNYYKKYGAVEGKTYLKEILNFYPNRHELNKAEKDLIGDLYKADPLCINLKEGGLGGGDGSPFLTPESRAKSIQTHILKYGSNTGAMNTPEAKAKSRAAHIARYGSPVGQLHTPEARLKSKVKSQRTHLLKYGKLASNLCTAESRAKAQFSRVIKYGNIMSPCNTPEARDKAKTVKIQKYGSLTGAMNTPEAKAKSQATRQIIYNRKRTICNSPEFQEWFFPIKNQYYSCVQAVSKFLQEKCYKLEDYPETLKS